MQAAGCVNLVYKPGSSWLDKSMIQYQIKAVPCQNYIICYSGRVFLLSGFNINIYCIGPPEVAWEVIMVKENVAGFHYELYKNCLVIYVTQDLDHHAVLSLRERSDKLIEAGDVKHVIFDFKDVGFMDSSGIGLLMGRYKKVMFLGGRAAVTSVGKAVDRIFKISGLYKIIEKYDTPVDAIKALEVKYEDYI